MAIEVQIPKLGDNVEAAEVVAILVKVGETIEANQSVIELESDKASMEVPSSSAGVVKEIKVSEGDAIQEGQVILILEETTSASVSTPAVEVSKPQSESVPSVAKDNDVKNSAQKPQGVSELLEVQVPKLGDNVDAAEIVAILVTVGETIEAHQSVIELESDKASMELPSSYAGVVKEIKVSQGDTVSEGQVILILEGGQQAEASKPDVSKPDVPKSEVKPAVQSKESPVPNLKTTAASAPVVDPGLSTGTPAAAAPSVRRFARELGVAIHSVVGTGPKGRISKADVKTYVKAELARPSQLPVASVSAAGPSLPPMPDFSKFGPIQTEKASNIRRATARQMSLSWQNIPHVTQFDQADITEVDIFRKTRGKVVEQAGGKLTVTAILLKICALALKRFPQFNASIDLENNQIIYKQYYHLGMAVDTPRGLMVPVLRDVDKKGLIDISVELGQIAGKARDRKISPDDLQGATFSISNLGGLGTTYFTPIVNWPEVAILGVGRASKQPVWQDDQFVPRTMMPLSISYDHRLIDGADAARFLRWIAEALENPLMLLMEGDL